MARSDQAARRMDDVQSIAQTRVTAAQTRWLREVVGKVREAVTLIADSPKAQEHDNLLDPAPGLGGWCAVAALFMCEQLWSTGMRHVYLVKGRFVPPEGIDWTYPHCWVEAGFQAGGQVLHLDATASQFGLPGVMVRQTTPKGMYAEFRGPLAAAQMARWDRPVQWSYWSRELAEAWKKVDGRRVLEKKPRGR